MEINENGPFFWLLALNTCQEKNPKCPMRWTGMSQTGPIIHLKNWGEGVPLKGSCSPVPHKVPLSSHSTSYVPYNGWQGYQYNE